MDISSAASLCLLLILIAGGTSIEADGDENLEQRDYDFFYTHIIQEIKSKGFEVLLNAMEHLRRRRESSSISSSNPQLQSIAVAEAIHGVYATQGVNDKSRRDLYDLLFQDLIKEPCERLIVLSRELDQLGQRPGVAPINRRLPEVKYYMKLLEVCNNQVRENAIDLVYEEYKKLGAI